MCKGKCNTSATDEQYNAVRNRVERMVEGAMDRLEEVVLGMQETASIEIAEVNRKLWDGMTKAELVAGIVDSNDMLSFDGLMEREDVQTAMAKSQDIQFNAFQKAGEIGGAVFNAEVTINDQAEKIMEEFVIFGMCDNVKTMLVDFESFIDSKLSAIQA